MKENQIFGLIIANYCRFKNINDSVKKISRNLRNNY